MARPCTMRRSRASARVQSALVVLMATLPALAGLSCAHDPTSELKQRSGIRVVLISLDGLRPDAITWERAPTLAQLASEGAAWQAKTILPSATLPAHTSMVTGLVPQRHGITWNDDSTSNTTLVPLTTVFDFATWAGYTSAMFVGKSKLSPIAHEGAPTRVSMPPVGEIWWADTVGAQVLAYLSRASPKPSLMFIHLPDIDVVGHAYGWMSDQYLVAVRHTDSVVARIWQGLKQTYGADLALIVTADHGGSGYGHAGNSILDMTIPWIAWGKGVTTPGTLPSVIRVVDTGPTVLWLLGIPPPRDWDGVPVTSAFPGLAP